MNKHGYRMIGLIVLLGILVSACGADTPQPEAKPTEPATLAPDVPDKITIAWIPKALNNPVFEVGRDGAIKKAEELFEEMGMDYYLDKTQKLLERIQ